MTRHKVVFRLLKIVPVFVFTDDSIAPPAAEPEEGDDDEGPKILTKKEKEKLKKEREKVTLPNLVFAVYV